jgi:peptidoglycan/LPS O-acetylase OafA/YrhL
VYLVHPLLIQFYKKIPFTHGSHPFGVQVLMAAVFLAVLLACSWLSYRWVEKPMQRHGRTFSRWLDTWFGPDPVPGAPAVAPEPALAHEAVGPREPVPGPANH